MHHRTRPRCQRPFDQHAGAGRRNPGRVHLYQGYSAAEVTSLVQHAHHLGCKDIIFAGATGAVSGNAKTGLGVITDQINLTGTNPLAEWAGLRDVETPFVEWNGM